MTYAPLCRFAALALVFFTGVVSAQTYSLNVDRERVVATPISQDDPIFPSGGFRTGQEGWVRVNFVVTPDGRATDPIIVDSIGGASFERAALEAVEEWTFEPSEAEIPFNVADMRFELYRGRDAATSNFLRRYRRIMTHVVQEEADLARSQVDAAVKLGGWNLYEEVMLSLMVGRVEGLEGDTSGKLEHYRRAITLANRRALDGGDRIDALSRIFEMEHYYGQYGAAMRTLAQLKREPRGGSAAESLEPKAVEIEEALAGAASFTVKGHLYTPCDCEEGQALWRYRPIRREFSFANVGGNVESFEARCRSSRLQGPVNTDRRWTLPESPRSCEIFIFGADGESFELVEHKAGDAPEAVATNDVVD